MDFIRQVRYNNLRSKQNPECDEWFFFIINQNREIKEIRQKIYHLFSPIIEEYTIIEGSVPGTGLRYNLIDFESAKKVEGNQIINLYPKIVRDVKLYSRQITDIEEYLSQFVDKD